MNEVTKAQRIVEKIVQVFGFATLIIAMLFILKPLFEQALSWLKTGIIPERDLFWATADVRCEATGYQAKGFEGMEICRPDYIHFTDWVGIDRIINYAFDIHIALTTSACLAFFWWGLFVLLEKIATYMQDKIRVSEQEKGSENG